MAASEIRSTIQSLKSRASNISARNVASKAGGAAAATSLKDGRLQRIEEALGEDAAGKKGGEKTIT